MQKVPNIAMIEQLKTEIIHLPEYDAVFRQNKQGWLGSDCAYSLPVPGNRVLWLFGDTFIEDSRQKGRNKNYINNSIAIQNGAFLDPNSPPIFYWDTGHEAPQSFFVNNSRPGFLWPLSAAYVNRKLYVFTIRIVTIDPDAAFAFKQTGNEIICVDNPEADPHQWNMSAHEIPWDQHKISFTSHTLKTDGYLYIYGYRKDGDDWQSALKLMIARIALSDSSDILNLNAWEYLNGFTQEWHRDIERIQPVFEHSNTEFSVSFLPGIQKYVLVANAWKFPNPVSIRVADTPHGPFSQPKIVYFCPETEWSPNYFCYAAKAHPELSEGDNDLVVTYMTNSKDLQECVNDTRIYYPRFLRIVFK